MTVAHEQSASETAIRTPVEHDLADVDFRVERREVRDWQISLLSSRARHWFEANYTTDKENARVLETDLAGANIFIQKARSNGFKTEYIGPFARSYF